MGSKKRRRSDGLLKAIEAAGGVRALARLLKVRHPSVMEWRDIPPHRLLEIERVTGVRRESLRPDFYIEDVDRPRRKK
jgi:DNA-binding transcriptional regulator YdaS (Cro superfamily)